MDQKTKNKIIGVVAAASVVAGVTAAAVAKKAKGKNVEKEVKDSLTNAASEVKDVILKHAPEVKKGLSKLVGKYSDAVKATAEEARTSMVDKLAEETKTFDEFYEKIVASPIFKKVTSVADLERVKAIFDKKENKN